MCVKRERWHITSTRLVSILSMVCQDQSSNSKGAFLLSINWITTIIFLIHRKLSMTLSIWMAARNSRKNWYTVYKSRSEEPLQQVSTAHTKRCWRYIRLQVLVLQANKKVEVFLRNQLGRCRCYENAILIQRNKQQLRWKTMNLLGQNGLCSAAWKSAAMYWLRMLQVR